MLSRKLAVRVAGEVVGLSDSRLQGMECRLDAFFSETDTTTAFGWRPMALLRFLRAQSPMAAFFLLDVKPAIRARRKAPKEDVISHLIAQGYGDTEILTECVTYGAAGMVTTREFICVAAWHLLDQPTLRDRYLVGGEEERYAILHEILRLEPVVGDLYRRATADLVLESDGQTVTIPAGALIDLHIHGTNSDKTVVGADPLLVCPARPLHPENATPAVMSFGDGTHRCPGFSVAIQEADIFLHKLLALPGLHIVQSPTVGWNAVVTGYEIRNFQIALG